MSDDLHTESAVLREHAGFPAKRYLSERVDDSARSLSEGGAYSVARIKQTEASMNPPGEVLVRMHAAPVNPSDLLFVRGLYGFKKPLPDLETEIEAHYPLEHVPRALQSYAANMTAGKVLLTASGLLRR